MTGWPHTSSGSLDLRRAALIWALRGFLEPTRGHSSMVTPLRHASWAAGRTTDARLTGIEDRTALVRRFRSLTARERLVLFRSYVEQIPAAQIAGELGISTGHCYKLRNRALDKLAADSPEGRAAW